MLAEVVIVVNSQVLSGPSGTLADIALAPLCLVDFPVLLVGDAEVVLDTSGMSGVLASINHCTPMGDAARTGLIG